MSAKDRTPSASRPASSPFLPSVVRKPQTGIVIAAAYGALMLYLGLKYHVVGDYGVETDFFWSYVPQAKQVLHGTFVIEDFRGPGYPTLLALTSLFTSDLFHAGIILATLAASASLYFSYETLKRISSADIAFVATLFVACNLTFIQYCYSAGTDMLFCAFVLGFFFFMLKDETLRIPSLLLAATFAAAAYLTRYNGIFVLLAVPVIVWFINPFQSSPRDKVKTIAIFIVAFFVLIAPWGIYCLKERGSFFFNRNYLNIAYEMFAKGRIGWDQYWTTETQRFGSLSQVVLADPGKFASTVASNLFEHFLNDLGQLVGWVEGVFVLFGIVVLWKERPNGRQLSFIVGGLCFFLILLLVFYGERLSMALLPLYGMLAATACGWHGLSTRKILGNINAGAVVALGIAAATLYTGYQFNKANIDSGPKEIPVIADWFKAHAPAPGPDAVIMTRKPHIAYYLGMRMTMFPLSNTLDELMAEAKKDSASYLWFSTVEAGMRPQFQQLLDPRKAPAWLTPIAYTVAPPAVLYQIKYQ